MIASKILLSLLLLASSAAIPVADDSHEAMADYYNTNEKLQGQTHGGSLRRRAAPDCDKLLAKDEDKGNKNGGKTSGGATGTEDDTTTTKGNKNGNKLLRERRELAAGGCTPAPTESPTTSPTVSPTASPTVSPTSAPTSSPTSSPTRAPVTNSPVSLEYDNSCAGVEGTCKTMVLSDTTSSTVDQVDACETRYCAYRECYLGGDSSPACTTKTCEFISGMGGAGNMYANDPIDAQAAAQTCGQYLSYCNLAVAQNAAYGGGTLPAMTDIDAACASFHATNTNCNRNYPNPFNELLNYQQCVWSQQWYDMLSGLGMTKFCYADNGCIDL
eukprot:CAMPEP_0172441526 /NCGR_PEP_ID=MMETSP1065-20121228/2082_1 /TAXON_ID=265537 /ORGANISM="Amphiprora paludosa, Strain CCMP125" /LENGTH=328 /DNA_ID=CAMNT_0013190961 /DNA_START=12 /DNA_END=998 /DNA_ORIENTATION=+